MHLTGKLVKAVAAGAFVAATAMPSLAADSVVKISLVDRGANSMDTFDPAKIIGIGTGFKKPKGQNAMLDVQADKKEVPAGKVTFEATNNSKAIVHEMIVSPVPTGNKPLPYDSKMNKVDEDAAGHLGEVSELEPGKTGSLTLTLAPGKYVMFCNIPGHYAMGMWTMITVK
jgi:uncharacterized cupredoxin-like copper-binding protein